MDEGAFERWYRAEHAKVLSALAVVALDVEVAREAVDEAFARAYERWARIGQMGSPAGWTYQTALNVLRRRARRSAMEERLLRRRSVGDRSDRPPSDWSAEVWDALRGLPLRERTAVALRYVADLSTEEIATAMRVAPGTVGSTLHAARARLAAILREGEAAAEPPLIELEEVPDG